MKKIASNQIVGLYNDIIIVRDLLENNEGIRFSIQKSDWIRLTAPSGEKINRKESAEELLKKYPIQKNVVY